MGDSDIAAGGAALVGWLMISLSTAVESSAISRHTPGQVAIDTLVRYLLPWDQK